VRASPSRERPRDVTPCAPARYHVAPVRPRVRSLFRGARARHASCIGKARATFVLHLATPGQKDSTTREARFVPSFAKSSSTLREGCKENGQCTKVKRQAGMKRATRVHVTRTHDASASRRIRNRAGARGLGHLATAATRFRPIRPCTLVHLSLRRNALRPRLPWHAECSSLGLPRQRCGASLTRPSPTIGGRSQARRTRARRTDSGRGYRQPRNAARAR